MFYGIFIEWLYLQTPILGLHNFLITISNVNREPVFPVFYIVQQDTHGLINWECTLMDDKALLNGTSTWMGGPSKNPSYRYSLKDYYYGLINISVYFVPKNLSGKLILIRVPTRHKTNDWNNHHRTRWCKYASPDQIVSIIYFVLDNYIDKQQYSAFTTLSSPFQWN